MATLLAAGVVGLAGLMAATPARAQTAVALAPGDEALVPDAQTWAAMSPGQQAERRALIQQRLQAMSPAERQTLRSPIL
jgi:hypothetical protein